ncbi:hypothetical protein E1292_40180, partial [Nonomuraea deserti]
MTRNVRKAEAAFEAELAVVRPELSAGYAAALPGARSAVLGRLWRSLLYEPLPGLADGPASLADGSAGLIDAPAGLADERAGLGGTDGCQGGQVCVALVGGRRLR